MSSLSDMIGIFDSGIGGLTVVKEINRQLPGYSVLYLGDTARTPYGTKSLETIRTYTLEDAQFLVKHGAKVIVIACNSASSAAADDLRKALSVPVFDVIASAAAAAVRATKKKRIGLIGTRATVNSGAYERAIHVIDQKIKVLGQACPLFVSLVEEGWEKEGEAVRIVTRCLKGLKTKTIDTLILGCTHYPILKATIQRKIGRRVKLVDSSEEVVKTLAAYLKEHPEIEKTLTKGEDHRFFVTDITEQFHGLAQRWLKRSLKLEKAEV